MRTTQKTRLITNHLSRLLLTAVILLLVGVHNVLAQQWNTNGNDISNANSGKVGIGTTAPSTKLDIIGVAKAQGFSVDGSAAEKTFVILWNNAVANQKVQVYWPASTQVDGIFEITVTGHYWYSNSNGGIRKRIVINGRSIGTINMQQSEVPFRLGFTGNSDTISDIMWDAANSRYYFIVSNLDNAQNAITIHVKSITPGATPANADNLNISAIYTTDSSAYPQLYTSLMGSNVGVGTTTPGYKLDVQGGQLNASGGLCIAGDCKTAWSQVGGGSSQWTTSGANIYYNSGNVGIGTTGPVEVVHVRKDQNAATHLLVENATAGASAYADLQVKNNLGHFAQFGLYSSTTTTAGALASGNAFTYTTSPAMVIMANNAAGVIKFATGGLSERMRIDASGNVGIGTTTPSQKLDINGNLNIQGGTTFFRQSSGLAGGEGAYVSIGATVNNEASFALNVYRAGTYTNRLLVNNFGQLLLQPAAGNVGIGTSNPATKLDVVGDVNASGTITGGNIVAKYQDVAEWVQSSQELAAGTVVVLDHTRSNQVIASSQAYDTRVAGVISLQPGITLGESGAGKVLVATTGRVRIKVDASRGSIQVGDLLVTSDVAGVAMKSQPLNLGGVQIHRPGTLIGKALEPFAKGTGEILVLLSLQ